MNTLIVEAAERARGMWHHRWVGIVVAWIVVIGGIMYLWRMPDQYEASARVYVDTRSILQPLMSGLAVTLDVDTQIGILSRTLITRPNVEKLIRMTDLDLNMKTAAEREGLINSLMGTLAIRGTGRDNLYTINFRDRNPDKAKRIVQALLSIFVETSLAGKRTDTDQAKRFIDEQIANYERKLVEAENRLKEFRLTNMRFLSGGGQDYVGSMRALDENLRQVTAELRAAEQLRDTLKRELAAEERASQQPGVEPVFETPEIDARIHDLGKQLDDLMRVYTDQHPDVTGTRRIIAMLKKEKEEDIARQRADYETRLQSGTPAVIAAARSPVYQQLRIALADAEAKVAALRARLQDARERYEELGSKARMVPEVEAQFAQLNRDYDVQHQNYTQLVARRESANLSSEMEETTTVAEFRIIDPPSVGTEPVAPNRLMILGLITAASLGAGLAVAFLATEVWPTFHSIRKLRLVTKRAVLGAVSAVPNSAVVRRRRRSAFAFSSAFAALLVGYGGAFAALFLDIRLP